MLDWWDAGDIGGSRYQRWLRAVALQGAKVMCIGWRLRRDQLSLAVEDGHRAIEPKVNLDHLAGTRRDELSRLFVRLRGHAAEMPVSRAYVHCFKAM